MSDMVSDCRCAALSEITGISFGSEDGWFDQLETRATFGEQRWWLDARQCARCGQPWLIASDTRVYDYRHLRRIEQSTFDAIVDDGSWPDCFPTYADVLDAGKTAGLSVAYFDPMASLELYYSIADLALERPGILVSRIAHLLPVSPRDAVALSHRVVLEEGVSIRFDIEE
jgi:hypothetical protein